MFKIYNWWNKWKCVSANNLLTSINTEVPRKIEPQQHQDFWLVVKTTTITQISHIYVTRSIFRAALLGFGGTWSKGILIGVLSNLLISQ